MRGHYFVTKAILDLCWRSLDGTLYQACAIGCGGRQVHLCVEAVPDGGWDWLVWPAENPAQNRYGVTATREDAVRAAERALAQLDWRSPPRSPAPVLVSGAARMAAT